jgi:hypothetical protein
MSVLERSRWAVKRGLAPVRLRPTFLVIGAQKSGTTSLRRYLVQHPAVVCTTPKEVHYFDVYHSLGRAWYLTHYPLRTHAVPIRRRFGIAPAVGEATPEYLFHPHAPSRAHAFDPSLRLIAVLRDPVDRAYSQFQMQVRKRGQTSSFEHALACEPEYLAEELEHVHADPSYVSTTGLWRSYVARGRYAEQLERWFELFPREQLLVLTSEELWDDPAAAVRAITRFLHVPEWQPESYPHQSAGTHAPMAPETREQLARVFEPENRRLEELLGRKLAWTRPTRSATTAPPGVSA